MFTDYPDIVDPAILKCGPVQPKRITYTREVLLNIRKSLLSNERPTVIDDAVTARRSYCKFSDLGAERFNYKPTGPAHVGCKNIAKDGNYRNYRGPPGDGPITIVPNNVFHPFAADFFRQSGLFENRERPDHRTIINIPPIPNRHIPIVANPFYHHRYDQYHAIGNIHPSNHQYNANHHHHVQQENKNEEPEWVSCGPTSKHDVIELHGFDDDRAEDDEEDDGKVSEPSGNKSDVDDSNTTVTTANSRNTSPPPARSTPTKSNDDGSIDLHKKDKENFNDKQERKEEGSDDFNFDIFSITDLVAVCFFYFIHK